MNQHFALTEPTRQSILLLLLLFMPEKARKLIIVHSQTPGEQR